MTNTDKQLLARAQRLLDKMDSLKEKMKCDREKYERLFKQYMKESKALSKELDNG